mmetsp:Transcript_12006/g.29544  ORF Transcript_12006/g.29544 Transcript_12006/m.29544 type:complete len:653 (-) Transcript_12006:322-2280(-)
MNFSPEQVAAAQEQMKNMSDEDIANAMKNFGAYGPQMSAMGIDPAMMQNAMNMMNNNPAMMKQAAQQMKNMSPEQMANMANMSRKPRTDTKRQTQGSSKSAPSSSADAPLTGRGARANNLKEEGRKLFGQKNVEGALDKFEDAILELDEYEDTLKGPPGENVLKLREACHLNAAACHLKLKSFKKAIRECSAVLQKTSSAKAYFRRATARKFLGTKDDIVSAISDLEKALKVDPSAAKCKQMLAELRTTATKMGVEVKSSAEQPSSEGKGKVNSEKPKPKETKTSLKHSGDPSGLSIRELKKLLDSNEVDYKGITEKSEMVRLVRQHCCADEGEPDGKSNSEAKSKAAAAESEGKEKKQSGVIVEDVDDEGPASSSSTASSRSPITESTTGGKPKIDLKMAQEQISSMSPEQMRMQAQMMRSMSPSVIRQMNPMMANFSDEQIKMAADNMERMANNPEQAKAQMRMASEMMKSMDSDQLHKLAEMQSSLKPSAVPPASSATTSTSSGTPPPSAMPAAAQPMPTQPTSFSSQQAQAMKMMENMDAKQLKSLMQMQRNMLKNNPAMFEQMKASNPAMAGLSREEMEQKLDMMADMDEQQLKQMMGMAQKVGKVIQPLMSIWGRFDKAVCGQGKNIVVAVSAIFVWYWIDYFFIS